MTSVVSPPASAASATCGESQCTCGSTPPGVTTMPVASITAVPVSSTTSIPSIVSGLPARPIATIRPPAMPMLAYLTPSTGSATRPPAIASSTPPRSARTPRPSRSVLPKPGRIRSGPPTSSASGTSHRSESASRTSPDSGTAVAPLARAPQCGLPRSGRVERSVDEAGVAADHARAAEREQEDLARRAGVEEDLRSGGDREPHAPRRRTVEAQRAVDLEEVEVRRDADRHVALVDARDRHLPREPLDLDLALRRRPRRRDRVVQHEQPAAVGEQRLGLRVRPPVAGGLADVVRDQRDGLGLVEPQAARAPLARELGGEEQQQSVLLAWEEAHRTRQCRTRRPGGRGALTTGRPVAFGRRGLFGAHTARPARDRRPRRRRA